MNVATTSTKNAPQTPPALATPLAPPISAPDTLQNPSRMAAPRIPPRNWATQYPQASFQVILPLIATPRVIAGLMWQPEMPPIV